MLRARADDAACRTLFRPPGDAGGRGGHGGPSNNGHNQHRRDCHLDMGSDVGLPGREGAGHGGGPLVDRRAPCRHDRAHHLPDRQGLL